MADTFFVKLVRPVFETTIVEITATGENAAMIAAVEKAYESNELNWTGSFDSEHYGIEVQSISPPDDASDDQSDTHVDEARYMMLQANVDTGEGAIVLHPWVDDIDGLMMSDLCGDWLSQLSQLEEMGLEFFYQSLPHKSATIIPFPKPNLRLKTDVDPDDTPDTH